MPSKFSKRENEKSFMPHSQDNKWVDTLQENGYKIIWLDWFEDCKDLSRYLDYSLRTYCA